MRQEWADIEILVADTDANASLSVVQVVLSWSRSWDGSRLFENPSFAESSHYFDRAVHSPWISLTDLSCTSRNNPAGFCSKLTRCESHEGFWTDGPRTIAASLRIHLGKSTSKRNCYLRCTLEFHYPDELTKSMQLDKDKDRHLKFSQASYQSNADS